MPLKNVLQIFLKMHQALHEACNCIYKRQYAEAQLILAKVLRLQPQSANAMYLYAICLRETGQETKSKMMKDSAYKLNPCFYTTLKNEDTIIKYICQNSKQAAEEIGDIKQDLNIRWGQLIGIFNKKKDLNSCLLALRMFEILKNPKQIQSKTAMSNLGLTYYQIGLYSESLQKYRLAISDQTDEFRYYNNSAIISYILGDYTKSQEFIQKSLVIKPTYAKTFFIHSAVLAKTGRIEEAMNKIRIASFDNPTSLMYRLKIVTNVLLYTQDTKQAKKQLEEIVRIIEKNEDFDNYFFSSDNKPLIQEASNFLKKVIQYQKMDKESVKQYVSLLDDYLIKGHKDKYFITDKMRKLKLKMEDKILESEGIKETVELNKNKYLPDILIKNIAEQQQIVARQNSRAEQTNPEIAQ